MFDAVIFLVRFENTVSIIRNVTSKISIKLKKEAPRKSPNVPV